LWLTASFFELDSSENWVFVAGIHDESKLMKYFTALYWATVTCTTVGYGDIIP